MNTCNADPRSPFDGRPYYCTTCHFGWGEYLACEEPGCRLEGEAVAADRVARSLTKRQREAVVMLSARGALDVPKPISWRIADDLKRRGLANLVIFHHRWRGLLGALDLTRRVADAIKRMEA